MTDPKYPKFKVYEGLTLESTGVYCAKIVAITAPKTRVTVVVEAAQLSSVTDCYKRLMNAGLTTIGIKEGKAQLLQAIEVRKKSSARIPSRSGWHDNEYVQLDRRVISSGPKTLWELASRRSRSPAAQPASNTELVDLLQTLIPQSDYLAFAVLVAFAGPLLEILGEPEGMIFHFCGESSTGKTTLAEVITAFTHQAHDRKLPPFNFTERGVEEIAYRANDSTFCMDEIGTMPPEQVAKIVRQVVYALANGGGKRRSGAAMVAEQFPQLDWRVICVLTGEIDIATTMLTAHSGTDARFIQINIPERTERGIFNVPATADTDEDAKFIDALKQACKLYTGDKFGEWVTYLADMPIQRRIRCRHLLDDYTRRLVGNDTDILRSRRARKMATIAMTGRLLRDAKLFDWRKQFPITMVERIYRSETASHMSLSEDRAVRNWLGQILLDALGNDEELAQHRHPGKKVSVSPSSDPVRYIEIAKDDLPTYLGDLEMRGVTRWLDKMNCLARSKRTSVFYQKRLTIDGRTDSVPTLRMDLKRAVQLFYRRGQE